MSWRNAAAKNNICALPNMEQLVVPHLTALSTHAGGCPCVLVGHSFGGLIAFELARQFQKQVVM
jgi:thioesterase domain-containing protein